MVFRSFRVRVLFRLVLLSALIALFIYLLEQPGRTVSLIIIGIVIVGVIAELFRYVERTNRKLTRFLESVRYSDFVSGFTSDHSLGRSFKNLNQAFNEVLEAFRKARSEKEEHLQYLNTVVEQVGTGLLSFDTEGNVELINPVAKKYLRAPQIHHIEEIKQHNEELYAILTQLPTGGNVLFNLDEKHKIAIHATEVILRGRSYKLITLHNIQPELQRQEIDSWQKLTRVLRHEIMNSITPIASLTSTLREILIEDLEQSNGSFKIGTDAVDDLQEGLDTIESRSTGLISFIDAYRDYTTIPAPKLKTLKLHDLLEHIINLLKIESRKAKVELKWEVQPEDLTILADEELMEQVLINLVKNAIEAVSQVDDPVVEICGKFGDHGRVIISIRDNGEGIIPEAQEKIFIPFFTTKKSGSGIGLALSRQIMQLHNGTLTVESEPNKYTEFVMQF